MATKQKYRYEIVAGIHYHPNENWHLSADGLNRHESDSHTKFVHGNVLVSDEDLETRFPGKFRRIVEGQTVNLSEARKKAIDSLISTGVSIEDDRPMLENLTDDAFERLQRMLQPKTHADSKKVISPLGEDVTDLYQQAYDHGFKVFRTAAGKCQVTRGDATKPLNPKALESTAVEGFVTSYLKESK